MMTEEKTKTGKIEIYNPIYFYWNKNDVTEYWAIFGSSMLIVWTNGVKTEIVSRPSFSIRDEYLNAECTQETFMEAYNNALKAIAL